MSYGVAQARKACASAFRGDVRDKDVVGQALQARISLSQRRDRSTEVRSRIIRKALDQTMPFERVLNDPALHPSPPSVYEPHFTQSQGLRFVDVFLDDRWNVAWGE